MKHFWWIAPIALSFFVMFLQRPSVQIPLDEIRVRITGATKIPDPAFIQNAGAWYYLDHISGGLAFYQNELRKFSPLFADSWSTKTDGVHLFKLRAGIQFHDGTPISAKDILWSLKRLIILKTSSHFPLWEYIEGCESLKSLTDECPGLTAPSPNEIQFKLKTQNESFFLQLASPETGIWASADMDPKTLKLNATKFSGPYYVESFDETVAVLKRNEYSPISKSFPNSPKSIILDPIHYSELDNALKSKRIDFTINAYRPYAEPNWADIGLRSSSTVPSEMIYLYGLGKKPKKLVGQDFLTELWKRNTDKIIQPADSFLPFNKSISLSRDEFLSQLPETSAKKIRILSLESFIPTPFIEEIKKSAAAVGTEVEFTFATSKDWYAAFDDPKAQNSFDFILSVYAASERYPAVQLRYLTSALAKPEIDLKKAESPDLNSDQEQTLKAYQKWLLSSQVSIPLFFNVTFYVYQPHINLGDQSKTDAEVELWRFTRETEQ